VDVPALRHAAARGDARRERVAVQHCDLRVDLGEHAGSQQPGHAPTEDDGVILHRGDLLGRPQRAVAGCSVSSPVPAQSCSGFVPYTS
jgi:hypothetical protein